ncbi:MAG TPA: hypothetical protein VLT32_15665 [Candidatus Sulfomarinibacteraceae bacterium]|nr:hypothetical protein [Candidatus Sulfomarinibacteraceae bacterium]
MPSNCGTGITFYTPPGLRPSAEAEIIEPYGNELYPRWDYPGVALRWRPAGQVRTDTYRVVAFDWRNKILDEIVVCPHDVCSYSAMFPIEPASYYWWVQPLADDTTGKQSRAGYFNLARPLTSCGGLGGTCSANTGPYGPSGCQGGGVPIYGAVDCPQECCSGDCSRDDTHDHSGSCGSTDVCGHVFGSPNDPGCGPEPPPDTMSCGELGGDHCSQTLTCPQGQYSMGTTRLGGAIECVSCCREAIGDGYCEPDEEDCGTSPDDCACRPGDVCVTSGYPSECVDQCSDPALHDHTGSCGELDECGHPVGDPRECLDSCGTMGGDHCSQTTACPSGYSPLGPSSDCLTCCEAILCQSLGCPAGSCGWQTDNCGEQIFCGECGPSCGETGGDYCSQTGSCPAGYASLGSTYDCGPCCRSLDSCGEMGGNYCSQTGSCPAGYNSLGASFDCSPCCKAKPCQSTGCPAGSCGWRTDNCGSSIFCGQCAPTCGAMGGDYCSQTNGCPGGYTSLGPSSDCKRCCKSPPSCGAMGGNYCSQTGSCPAGYTPLGQSNDCSPCCVSN